MMMQADYNTNSEQVSPPKIMVSGSQPRNKLMLQWSLTLISFSFLILESKGMHDIRLWALRKSLKTGKLVLDLDDNLFPVYLCFPSKPLGSLAWTSWNLPRRTGVWSYPGRQRGSNSQVGLVFLCTPPISGGDPMPFLSQPQKPGGPSFRSSPVSALALKHPLILSRHVVPELLGCCMREGALAVTV